MKQRRLNCNFALRKCKKRRLDLEDRISQLPDELRICILSHLTMKEAARTSVLSTGWKDMWTYSTGAFNFDALKALRKVRRERNGDITALERGNYISWVNRVLNSHKGATMDELRVHFDLSSCCQSSIDNWVHYAFKKRVKRLELDFLLQPKAGPEGHYSLSLQGMDFSRLESLTTIRLTDVDVTAECLECFLSNCPLLEEISIDSSMTIVGNFKVHSQSLKHLRIVCCWSLEVLEISAKNLMSLEYFGEPMKLCFKTACNLSTLSLGRPFCRREIPSFSQISSYISQLQVLVLEVEDEEFHIFPRFPEFRNLKHLTLKVRSWYFCSLLPCILLLEEACLCLHKFSIQAVYQRLENPLQQNVVQRDKECALQCLKEVEFIGFSGHEVDLELSIYLLENVVTLEKMTIDTRKPYSMGTEQENVEDENRIEAKMFAMDLQTKLPRGVELMII